MAIQHLVAFSESVQGAGIAAGSPYGCGMIPGGHLPQGRCWYGPATEHLVQETIKYMRQRFNEGLIDDPVNLKQTPVVLFNGKQDWTVFTAVMQATYRQLSAFIEPRLLTTNFETEASHVWSLDHGSCKCGACADFSVEEASKECCDVNNCEYDLSGDMLRHFYGHDLKPRVRARQRLKWIDQSQYTPWGWDFEDTLMSTYAIAYVPTGCLQDLDSCRVHIDYHGCINKIWSQREKWATAIDLNEYGEANNIVIVYPQAAGDRATGRGCWNWGFPQDDKYFDTRKGAQLKTIVNMVADLKNAVDGALEAPVGKTPSQVFGLITEPKGPAPEINMTLLV